VRIATLSPAHVAHAAPSTRAGARRSKQACRQVGTVPYRTVPYGACLNEDEWMDGWMDGFDSIRFDSIRYDTIRFIRWLEENERKRTHDTTMHRSIDATKSIPPPPPPGSKRSAAWHGGLVVGSETVLFLSGRVAIEMKPLQTIYYTIISFNF